MENLKGSSLLVDQAALRFCFCGVASQSEVQPIANILSLLEC